MVTYSPDPVPVTSTPHPARIYAHWIGEGKDSYAVDRFVADEVAKVAPWVVAGARGSRSFLTRAITCLAKAGICQFLDIGTGMPTARNVHEIAQKINPRSRVVYVDRDPIVLAHARALLATRQTIAVAADAREPEAILTEPAVRAHLDFGQPIAVILSAVLPFISDTENPAGIVAAFRDGVAPGSHLVISHAAHLTSQNGDSRRARATAEAAQRYTDLATDFTLRTPDQIAALFTGWQLLPPGLVPANQWRPRRGRPGPPIPVLAGIGRLPHPDETAPGQDEGADIDA